MSDADALLNAIAAHPEEDTPRLMFADWLDEHGHPVRAEFIRVQIAIAQKEHLPRAMKNRFVDLYKRNQELIDDHRAELLGPLKILPPKAEVEFRRGFVWEVGLSAFHFNQHRHTIAEVRPRPRVAVKDSVGVLGGFLGFNIFPAPTEPLLELVTSIHTVATDDDDSRDWGLEDEPAVLQGLTWPRLEALDISGSRLGNANTILLLTYSSYPVLSDLDVSANYLTDAAVEALLDSSLPTQLRRLILGGNDITSAGAIALAERWPTDDEDRLEHLNLRFSSIGPAGQSALLRRFGGRVDLF
jgi:uncharacterized protein (TIGR02996 family)